MFAHKRFAALAVALVISNLSQIAIADDGPWFVHSGTRFSTNDVNYITHVNDNFEITIQTDDTSHPDDYEVCDPDLPPFNECYRYPRDLVDLEVVSGLPAGATATKQDCDTWTTDGGGSATFCSGQVVQWLPVPSVLDPQEIVVQATSRTVTFKFDSDGEWVAAEIEPVASAQIAYSHVGITVTEINLASVEITQVIQVEQTPEELQAYLDDHDGNPPVPIVAEKPVALRVIPDEVTELTSVEAEFWTRLIEPELEDPPIEPELSLLRSLSPLCSAEDRRRRTNIPPATCRSIDIYQKPGEEEVLREGKGDFWVFLKYPNSDQMENLATSIDQAATALEVWDAKCSPAPDGHYRGNDPGCRYLYSPEYLNRFEANRFTLSTKKSDELRLHAVDLCTSLDNSQCVAGGAVAALKGHVRLLRKFAPTHAVKIFNANVELHLGLAADDGDGDSLDCYDRPVPPRSKTLEFGPIDTDGDGLPDTNDWATTGLGIGGFCESEAWWEMMLAGVEDAFTRSKLPRRTAEGVQNNFFGLANAQALHGGYLGLSRIENSSAIGVLTGNRIFDEETVAHETGHMLTLDDTNKPASGLWPEWWVYYPDEHIWSGDPVPDGRVRVLEVGLDVQKRDQRRAAKPGELRFDFMSYKRLTWVSPFHYIKMLDRLDPPPPDPAGEQGQFWLVSGFVGEQSTIFSPLFEFDTVARTDTGSGTHRIEVQDAAGGALFSRSFTPVRSQSRVTSGDTQYGRPRFSEMIPVQPAATSIAIIDNVNTAREPLLLGGAAPIVSIDDLPGGFLNGLNIISWSVSDADSEEHVFWIEYSANGGANWSTLTTAHYETNLDANFDALPGSNGNALIRVLASDGVNTGSAVSNMFSVAKKVPEVEIFSPETNEEFYGFDGVVLEGFGYDLDDGVLTGTSLVWESDQFGYLGTGEELSIPEVPAGVHVVTLTATDSDGNTAFETVTIIALDGQPTEMPVGSDPIADAGGAYSGDEGGTIIFDGSLSFDPDGGALTHGWDFGDGVVGAGVAPYHTYVDDGDFDVLLTVVDMQSLDATDTTLAIIRNVAPEVYAEQGPIGEEGDSLTLRASFSDPGINDGPWEAVWNYGDGLTTRVDVSVQGDIASDHVYSQFGVYPASVTVYDKDGSSGTDAFEVVIHVYPNDNDGDGISDEIDPDDDNDGMTDEWEIANGLNPVDPADANGNLDTDSLTNIEEYLAGTDPRDSDSDDDAFADDTDNCPTVANANQADIDGDGIGDVCAPPSIVSLSDLNGDGSPEIAVLIPGVTNTVQIRDGSSDALINDIDFGADSTIGFAALPDLDSSGKPEIAVLNQQDSGHVRVQIRDSVNDDLIGNLWYGLQYKPVSMTLVPDYSGNGDPEIAVLGSERGTDAVRVQLRDSSSDAFVGNVFLGTQSIASDLVSVRDTSGNGKPEMGILGVLKANDQVRMQMWDADTAAFQSNIWFAKVYQPQSTITMPDINSNGSDEIVAVGVDPDTQNIRVQVRDSDTTATLYNIWLGAVNEAVDIALINDVNSDSFPDLAILLKTPGGTGRVRVQSGLNGNFIRNLFYSVVENPVGLAVMPDYSGNGFEELATLGENAGVRHVQILDTSSAAQVNRIDFPQIP